MRKWIALLRGINVGGRNRLPMDSLSTILRSAGCHGVKTYIQSGNVVFIADIASTTRFADSVSAAIEKHHDFRPAVYLLTAEDLDSSIAANPYPEAESEPKSLHLFFLDRLPQEARLNDAKALLAESESATVVGRCLYLYAPDGIGRSRFAQGVDRVLGIPTTARNWRTVRKLAELAAEPD